MRAVERTMSGNLRGKPLMGLLALAFALIAAYEAAKFIISGDTTGLIYVAIALVLAAFVVSMLNNWRRGVYIFFAWLLFGVLFRLPHLKAKAEVKSADLALAAQQPRWVT